MRKTSSEMKAHPRLDGAWSHIRLTEHPEIFRLACPTRHSNGILDMWEFILELIAHARDGKFLLKYKSPCS